MLAPKQPLQPLLFQEVKVAIFELSHGLWNLMFKYSLKLSPQLTA